MNTPFPKRSSQFSVDSNEAFDSTCADVVLDAKGLRCPEPIMMLHNAVRDLAVGQVLKLESTDPSSVRDVEKFCLYLSHELLHVDKGEAQKLYSFYLRKGV